MSRPRRRRSRALTRVLKAIQPDGLELRDVVDDDGNLIAYDLYNVGTGRGRVGRVSKCLVRDLARRRTDRIAQAFDVKQRVSA